MNQDNQLPRTPEDRHGALREGEGRLRSPPIDGLSEGMQLELLQIMHRDGCPTCHRIWDGKRSEKLSELILRFYRILI
jgi:hypothetical protein